MIWNPNFLMGLNFHFQASIHFYPWLTLPCPYPSHAWFPCPKLWVCLRIVYPKSIALSSFSPLKKKSGVYPICKAHDISIGFPLDSHEINVKSPFQHLEGIFPDFPIFSLGFPYDFPMPNLGSQATSGSAPCHLVPSRGPTWTAPTWAARNKGWRPGSLSAMWGLGSHWHWTIFGESKISAILWYMTIVISLIYPRYNGISIYTWLENICP